MADTTYLYVMENTYRESVKIGVAGNPEARLMQVQTGNTSLIVLRHTIEFDKRKTAEGVERLLHMYFRHERIRGEWFDIAPDDALEAYTLFANTFDGFSDNCSVMTYELTGRNDEIVNVPEMASCPCCGGTFTAKSNKIYCSSSCRAKASKQRTENWESLKPSEKAAVRYFNENSKDVNLPVRVVAKKISSNADAVSKARRYYLSGEITTN